MEQTVIAYHPTQADNVGRHRKESSFRRQLTLVDLSTGEEVITVRFYGKGSVAHCCAWLHSLGQHARGAGQASGYGYHKDSAAMANALNAAGWRFEHAFDGVGEAGERTALEAIAAWLVVPRFVIVSAHP